MKMSAALGGQIAIVHAFGTVFAGRAAIIVDTLSLPLATAHTGAAGSQRRATHDRRHGEDECKQMSRQLRSMQQ